MQPALAPAPMQQSSAQDVADEQSLREHLLAAASHQAGGPHHHGGLENMQASSSASEHDHNIDPAIAGSNIHMSTSDQSGGDDNLGDDKKGGKRELSTSKRAAQNRAAQRAFRQRKETYIKTLEDRVRDYNDLNENYKAVQAENYQLRDYILNLQSRLIESQGEYPQPPSNIALAQTPSGDGVRQIQAPTASMAQAADDQLQASARQAIAEHLGAPKHANEDAVYLNSRNEYPSKRLRSVEAPDMTMDGAVSQAAKQEPNAATVGA
ncbi:MAG: hypothetical protein M1835_003276 [Candelina submexicana]|nr:MAG: hypothetical protein M1835_003276 [Candelina submexicana]